MGFIISEHFNVIELIVPYMGNSVQTRINDDVVMDVEPINRFFAKIRIFKFHV